MHIVIEGPDGSGKTTLLEKLRLHTNLPQYPRASTSKEGPIADVAGWVEKASRDISFPNTEFHIFDRHAIISEPIYAPTLGRQSNDPFYFDWWVTRHRLVVARHAMVVFCLPPKYMVQANIIRTSSEQMPGVARHAATLYDLYDAAWRSWPGPTLHYDYDLGPDSTEQTIETIKKWAGR